MQSGEIVVSISCITYNHAPYIRQCLDGFMMQQTSFAFEVLIHDDASTDGTTEIIKEYESKYPDIIKPIYEEENQWVKGRRGSAVFNFPRAKGKYIAMCEGDDYWTDPLKLQKQVDFLENNPEYSVSVTRFRQFNQSQGRFYDDVCPNINVSNCGMTFNLQYYINSNNWITQPLTAVFDKEILNLIGKYRNTRDLVLFYALLKHGSGFLDYSITGVYRVSRSGIYSMVPDDIRNRDSLMSIYNIYLVDKDKDSILYLKYYFELCVHGMGKSFFLKNMNLIVKTMLVLIRSVGLSYIYYLIKFRKRQFKDYRRILRRFDCSIS